jgi:hypothetical protein
MTPERKLLGELYQVMRQFEKNPGCLVPESNPRDFDKPLPTIQEIENLEEKYVETMKRVKKLLENEPS